MNDLKPDVPIKRSLKMNKKQLLLVLCTIGCLGLVLASAGIFRLIRNDLVTADTSRQPDTDVSVAEAETTLMSEESLTAEATETTVPTVPTTASSKKPSTTAATTHLDDSLNAIASLSGNCLNWGQGTKFDELNRPVYALSNQKKYAAYSADFIKVDENKEMYLTLDEGYENGYTSKILDVLKEKNVPVVFFVTEPYAKANPDLVKRMIAEGHILGNHSVTHPSAGLPSQTLEQQENEIMGCHKYVQDNFHYTMNLFRFPSGKFSEQSLAVVNYCHYRSVFWSFAYLDYDVNHQPDEKQALDLLTARLHPGAIYLLHAESKTNTDILGEFIDKARDQGYTFLAYTQ